MDSFEWNKVFMAVIGAMLSVMFISTFTPALFENTGGDSAHGHGEHAKLAFAVEVAEAEVQAEAEEEEQIDLGVLLASADVGKGERQFGKCKGCHSIEAGGRNGTGPNLYGIVGAAVAAKDGFNYSGALKEYGGEWTYDRLDAWLANPKNTVPGNKMSFAGLRRPDRRADLILYLRSFDDAPPALPAPLTDVAEAEAGR